MDSKIVKNYAHTLFDIATERSVASKVLEELVIIEKLVQGDKSVQEFLCSALVSEAKKREIISKVFKETSLDEVTFNFIKILAKNNRMNYLASINAALKSLDEVASKKKVAIVRYARDFSASDEKQIKELLEKKYDHDFSLSFKQDKALIAGVVVSFDNIVIDASVKGMMDHLAEQLDDAYLQSIN